MGILHWLGLCICLSIVSVCWSDKVRSGQMTLETDWVMKDLEEKWGSPTSCARMQDYTLTASHPCKQSNENQRDPMISLEVDLVSFCPRVCGSANAGTLLKTSWTVEQTLVMRYQQMKQMAFYGGFKGFGKGKAPCLVWGVGFHFHHWTVPWLETDWYMEHGHTKLRVVGWFQGILIIQIEGILTNHPPLKWSFFWI